MDAQKIKIIILNNSEDKVFGCIHCQEDTELIIDDLSILSDKLATNDKETANKIVNGINKEFNLNLLTVDSAQMQDYIQSILNQVQ